MMSNTPWKPNSTRANNVMPTKVGTLRLGSTRS